MQEQQKPHLRRTALWAAFVLAGLAAAPVVHAQAEPPSVNIAAQPLGAALDALAVQAKIKLLYSPDAVKGKAAPALTGRHAPEAALGRLLAGSGLIYVLADGAYAIKPAPPSKYGKEEEASPRGKSAAQTDQNIYKMPEMVITATRTERRVDEVPASVSVISSQDLERQHVLKVEDSLKNIEGIDFNSVPGNAGASVPMIRGIGGSFAGATSAVLVDGLATDSYISNVLGRGGFNFLAEQDVERIEVVRGPASALYGPNVVGGVVNVIPKRWIGEAGGEIHAGLGSHNAKSFGAIVGSADEHFDIRLSAYDFQTDGFIAKPDSDPWGEKDTHNRSWQDRKWNLSGALRPSNDQEIALAVQQFRTSQDYTGGLSDPSQKVEGDAYTVSYRKEFSGGSQLKLSYRRSDLLQSWVDSADGMGVGDRKSISDTVDVQADLHPLEDNTLIFGASYQNADYKTRSLLTNSSASSTAKSTGAFVQDEHRFGNLIVIAGGRYDRIDQGGSTQNGVVLHNGASETTFNPRGGLRYHFSPITSAYASVGTAFVPASADLKYIGSPTRFQDNPGLKPEKSTTYEVGVNHKLPGIALRAAIYHTNYEDKISAISVGAATWPRKYVNIGRVEVDGLELGIDGNLPGGWKPYANYAYTGSIIKENPSDPLTEGKRVQRVAPHKLNLGVMYVPGGAWQASFMGRYVSERYFTDYNIDSRRTPGYFVGDFKVSAKLPAPVNLGHWDAFLAVNNLFDKKYTVWEYEYADGRNLWFGLNGKF